MPAGGGVIEAGRTDRCDGDDCSSDRGEPGTCGGEGDSRRGAVGSYIGSIRGVRSDGGNGGVS